ncbi:MAG: acyltransferase [Planctomycetota bacterium]|nr:acyltransferase [Planctomycetota bacterium]
MAKTRERKTGLRVGVFQYAPVFGDKERNIKHLLSHIEKVEFDVLVLPELFATGYQFKNRKELASLAESSNDGTTIRELIRIAKRKDALLVAGFAEKTRDGGLFNSAAVVAPDGVLGVYRKIHLFDREKELFDSGNESPKVFEFRGVKIGAMICFDWMFPETARTLALLGVQMLAHCANLVLPYCQRAMFARAVENRVFTVTANRTGTESRIKGEKLRFTGGSIIYSPKGEILLQLGEEEEKAAVVELQPKDALDKQITKRNHIFNDRRPSFYMM